MPAANSSAENRHTVQTVTPGLYPDLPPSAYHAGPGTSKTHLDLIRRAPQVYYEEVVLGTAEGKDTDAMVEGDALHALVFEPETRFVEEFALAPTKERRSNADKAAWQELEDAGFQIVRQAAWDRVHRMRDAIYRHPAARKILEKGAAEQSYYGFDPDTGEPCRCRLDWVTPRGLFVDLKTAPEGGASPWGFFRKAKEFRYYVQAPYYLDVGAWSGALDSEDSDFVFLVVEKEAPHLVGAYYMPPELMDWGRRDYREDLDRLVECRTAGYWPGYSDRLEPMPVPEWLAR